MTLASAELDVRRSAICPAGSGGACDFVSAGELNDKSGKVGSVEVVLCSHCGHGISLPPLTDIAFLYENRASQDYQPDTKGLARSIKQVAFRLQAKALLKQLGITPRSILDFGCGSGQFTRVLGDVARGTEVVGADFHPQCPPELQGRPYLSSSKLSESAGSYDVVLAMHVLEHDDDVVGLLDQIVSNARLGGKVVIEVPNVDCVWRKPFGRHWDAWYLPYHRHHFTRQSLLALLQRSTLRVDNIYDVTVPTMGRSFANIAGQKNGLAWLLLGVLAHPLQWMGEVLTRRPTALRVLTTKVG